MFVVKSVVAGQVVPATPVVTVMPAKALALESNKREAATKERRRALALFDINIFIRDFILCVLKGKKLGIVHRRRDFYRR